MLGDLKNMKKQLRSILVSSLIFIIFIFIFIVLMKFVNHTPKNTKTANFSYAIDNEKKDLSKKIMEELYKNITGFIELSPEERASIEGGYTKKCSIYGEILYDSLQYILDKESFGPTDVFYDFGSGVGKVVIQVYLNTPVRKAIGIELSISRNNRALSALDSFKKTPYFSRYNHTNIEEREIDFYHENILKTDISDATIIYMASSCFAPELLEKLVRKFEEINRKGLKIITFKELPDYQAHGFQLDRTYSLPMSWSINGATTAVFVFTYTGEKVEQKNTIEKNKEKKS